MIGCNGPTEIWYSPCNTSQSPSDLRITLQFNQLDLNNHIKFDEGIRFGMNQGESNAGVFMLELIPLKDINCLHLLPFFLKSDRWWMTWGLTSLWTVFQSYQDDGKCGYEELCAMTTCLGLERILHPAGFDPTTWWSEVRNNLQEGNM